MFDNLCYNYINGVFVKASENYLDVFNKYSNEFISKVPLANSNDLESAVESSLIGAKQMRSLNAEDRANIFYKTALALEKKKDYFVNLITQEAGKPISYSKIEVDRAISNLHTASREALSIYGENLPVDFGNSKGKLAITKRFPLGNVLCITPFNFPLNLVIHKIAPAIAMGNSVILKPAIQTPLSSLALLELFLESGLPNNAIQCINCSNDLAQSLVTDSRIAMLSFTGSDKVGWMLKSIAGKKKVALELGGSAPVIIDECSDFTKVASEVAKGSNLYAGQTCISTQKVYCNSKIYDEFKEALILETKNIISGNPIDSSTINSSMIDKNAIAKAKLFVEDALAKGGKLDAGGNILDDKHNIFEPTIISNTNKEMFIHSDEAFAPICAINKFDNFEDAIGMCNDSRYGLQIGVYTNNIDKIKYAFTKLEYGGIIINSIPGFRIDSAPYGGIKDSGIGREGIKIAMEEMSEIKLLVM